MTIFSVGALDESDSGARGAREKHEKEMRVIETKKTAPHLVRPRRFPTPSPWSRFYVLY